MPPGADEIAVATQKGRQSHSNFNFLATITTVTRSSRSFSIILVGIHSA